MPHPISRDSARAEMGRRHPFWTLYGGRIVAGVAVVAVVLLAVAGLSHLHVGRPHVVPGWLAIAAGVALLAGLLWVVVSPERRFRRQMRRERRRG